MIKIINITYSIVDMITIHYKITFENYVLTKEEFCSKEDFFDVHLSQI